MGATEREGEILKLQKDASAISCEASGERLSTGPKRPYTTKQMGDACEMLVVAELTLAGIPAMKAPDYWPHYDVVAQTPQDGLQRISVKSRTFKRGAAFVDYKEHQELDWLAVVLLQCEGMCPRQIFLIPRGEANSLARTYQSEKLLGHREFRIDEIRQIFSSFENNFRLSRTGTSIEPAADAGSN